MHSATLLLSLLAGGVLSSPAPHGAHRHSIRQNPEVVDVVDVVDVTVTVTAGNTPPTAFAQPQEKMAIRPVDNAPVPQQPAAPSSAPAPPVSSAPPPPPASTTAPAKSGSSPTSSGNGYLDMHNKFRAAHGAVPMTWDAELASKAQSQAASCPNDDVQAGSNWYGSSAASTDVAPAVQAWYNEMDAYAKKSNNYASNPSDGGADTGHFSQMIWNASTSLGCGLSSSCGNEWVTQVTCLYMPAGNMVFNGEPLYTKNVFPPS